MILPLFCNWQSLFSKLLHKTLLRTGDYPCSHIYIQGLVYSGTKMFLTPPENRLKHSILVQFYLYLILTFLCFYWYDTWLKPNLIFLKSTLQLLVLYGYRTSSILRVSMTMWCPWKKNPQKCLFLSWHNDIE